MTCRELRDPYLSSIIAKKLANVHTLDVPIHKEPTWLFDTISNWLDGVRSRSIDDVPISIGNRKLIRQLMAFDYESEILWLKKVLKACKSPVLFCHNDLQEGNILLPDVQQAVAKKKRKSNGPNGPNGPELPIITEDRVVLIDFEYCSYNYRGFDIANHFCEWAFDYSNPSYPCFYANEGDYPSDKQRRQFVRDYLNQFRRQSKDEPIEQDTEEHILMEAEYFMLASHFMWTLWAINNGFTSQIQFGYWEYGKVRLSQYLKHKETLRNRETVLFN
jgi:choline/ethanolamine kinase